MAINHGRLTLEPIIIEGRPYGLPVAANGTLWKDYVSETDGHWFIVALEDGTIISAETDPMQSLIVGFDIVEIEHPGPAEAIRGRHWDGEKVT